MELRGAGTGVVAGLAAVLGAGSLLAACGGNPSTKLGLHRPSASPAAARLVAFDSCSQLLGQIRTQALAEVGPQGLESSGASNGGFAINNGAVRAAAPQTVHASAGASVSAPSAADATGSALPGTTPSPSSPDYSSTNVQEAGVDEADLAKTDGTLLVTLRRDNSTIEVADVGSTPRLRGSLSLTDVVEPTGLFLVGGDAVVLGAGPSPSGVPQPLESGTAAPPAATVTTSAPGTKGSTGTTGTTGTTGSPQTMPVEVYTPTTVVAVVSLADPDHPSVIRSFTVQGNEVDARLIAGHIEVVVTSAPSLPFVTPSNSSSAAQADALAQNKAVIEASQPADWLPSVTSEPSGVTQTTACTAAMHPAVASGLGTVSVVPIDPSSSQPGPESSVVGDATTVYASTTSLYVATTAWTAPTPIPMGMESGVAGAGGTTTVRGGPQIAMPSEQPPTTTDIHGFDLSDPGAPQYLGSAAVTGSLIGQYALSEYQGYLRVATTVGSATPPPNEGVAPSTLSDNRVTILQPQAGALVTVGTISGLGTGEKIYAVRFIGPLGYVVTFRQTDPLYVIDLHDPHNPQLAGQVQLDGYSSFLQPLSSTLLLGVGQEVDQNLRRTGLQLSLFDVSDPAHPKLLSKDVLQGASSSAENDPHALLYWAPSQLAVLPVTEYPVGPVDGTSAPTGTPFDGVVAFSVAGGSVTEAGRVSQPAPTSSSSGQTSLGVAVPAVPPTGGGAVAGAIAMPYQMGTSIERALVVGSKLYTVSETGILASDLGSFSSLTWMPFS